MTQSEHLAKFNESVSILVKAYLNDTLEHGNPCACAVGNLVASSCQITYMLDLYSGLTWDDERWPKWFFSPSSKEAQVEYDAVGYSVNDIMRIEHAFESGRNENCRDDDGWHGLMNVVSVLASIHGVDLETTEAARKMFVKV